MGVVDRLAVSVIEARDVVADSAADADYYVRLQLGAAEARTEASCGSAEPKFLRDFRFEVVDVAEPLRVQLLQRGPHGDLVVGAADVDLTRLRDRETEVQWLDVHGSTRSAMGAQLCIVVRFSSAAGSRGAAGATPAASEMLTPPLSPQRTPNSKEGGGGGVASAAGAGALSAPGTPCRLSDAPASPPHKPLLAAVQHLRASIGQLPAALSTSLAHGSATPLPRPLAAATGMLFGALFYLLRRPPAVVELWDRERRRKLGRLHRKDYGHPYWSSPARTKAHALS